MYIVKLSHNVAMYFALLIAFSAVASAQATRTWVSGVGDDANPCSRTAPCKTFQGTISKTAANGEINSIDPGGFGAVTVTKSITIDGSPFMAGVLVSTTNGIIINAAGASVTLRNLVIDGVTTGLSGIKILNADAVFVENCQIFGFNRGISDERTAGKLFVTNSILKNNVQANAYLGAGTSVNAVFNNDQLSNSTNYGFWFSSGFLVIKNCIVSGNRDTGVLAEGTSDVDIDGGVVSSSLTGVSTGSGTSAIRISNVTVTMNRKGLSTPSGSIDSYSNNKIVGNQSTDSPTTNINLQ